MSESKQELQTAEKHEVQTPEGVERIAPKRVFVPRADIFEQENEVVILSDMPGVKAADVEIMMEKDVLSLRGHVDGTDAPHGGYQEYETGDYERQFTVSNEIDRDRIEAEMKDGVLRVRLPKSPSASARTIPVKASA